MRKAISAVLQKTVELLQKVQKKLEVVEKPIRFSDAYLMEMLDSSSIGPVYVKSCFDLVKRYGRTQHGLDVAGLLTKAACRGLLAEIRVELEEFLDRGMSRDETSPFLLKLHLRIYPYHKTAS